MEVPNSWLDRETARIRRQSRNRALLQLALVIIAVGVMVTVCRVTTVPEWVDAGALYNEAHGRAGR